MSSEPAVTRRSLMSCCSSAPERRPQAVAHVVEVEVGRRRARHGPAGERGLLEVRQHRQRAVVTERPARRGDGPLLADDHEAEGERLGLVLVAVGGGLGDERRRQVAEADVPSSRGPARDRGRAGGGRCRRRGAGGGRPTGGRARRRRPRSRHRRGRPSGRTTTRASPCPALPAVTRRGTRTPARSASSVDEALVLDELQAAEADGALRPAVPRQAPDVRQQLGVPGVASVDLDVERPGLRRSR